MRVRLVLQVTEKNKTRCVGEEKAWRESVDTNTNKLRDTQYAPSEDADTSVEQDTETVFTCRWSQITRPTLSTKPPTTNVQIENYIWQCELFRRGENDNSINAITNQTQTNNETLFNSTIIHQTINVYFINNQTEQLLRSHLNL